MKSRKKAGLLLLFYGFSLIYTGCAIHLVPKYDQTIVDSVSSISTDIFTLIAETSDGVTAADFSKREPEYNNLLGETQALILQINTRPEPKNKTADKIRNKINGILRNRGVPAIDSTQTAPSATALGQVMNNLNQMKTADKAGTLTPTVVQLFSGNIKLYLDQALTYEKFLNQENN